MRSQTHVTLCDRSHAVTKCQDLHALGCSSVIALAVTLGTPGAGKVPKIVAQTSRENAAGLLMVRLAERA